MSVVGIYLPLEFQVWGFASGLCQAVQKAQLPWRVWAPLVLPMAASRAELGDSHWEGDPA